MNQTANQPTSQPTSQSSQPLVLRVLTPDATPEQVAALVAVFSAIGNRTAPTPKPRSQWASPQRRLHTLPPHGRGAWKASGLPY